MTTPGAVVEYRLDPRVQQATTDFGFRLFSRLVNQNQMENVVASPLSVASALAMAYNGAERETREAMANTLGFEEMTLDEVNHSYAALRSSLSRADGPVELALANSLWAREDVTFNPDFLGRNHQFYGAEVTTLDFGDPAAPEVINRWVADQTRGKIDGIVDEIDPLAVLFLINAVYFNGEWTVAFDEDMTRDRTFYLPDGSEKQHPMMSQMGQYQYLENDDFQAASLPYGEGDTSMYIFLPQEDTSLTGFLANLDVDTWESWLDQFNNREGNIVLPKFRAEYEKSLIDPLGSLGMGIAFDRSLANFDGMHDGARQLGLHIEEVKHKAFIEVNEAGTEAAAATSVGMEFTSIEPDKPPRFSFVADRPFFYAIRDGKNGSIIFMGVVMDPQV
jgi:serpin B